MGRSKKKGLLLFLLLIMLLFSSFVSGEEESIRLRSLRGDVLHRGSEFFHAFEPAREGMAIYPGETIRVGVESNAEIVFPDGVEILLKDSTEVRIHVDEVGDLELRVLQVQEGEVIVKQSEGLLDRVIFEVETPSAIAAVRGTIFRIRSDEFFRTTASVLQGILEVSSHNPTSVILTAGYMTTVDPDEPPKPPFPFTDDERRRWDDDSHWVEDDNDEVSLEERIVEFYQSFANTYVSKDIDSLIDFLSPDWSSADGDTVESLKDWLSVLYRGFDTFSIEIQIEEIEEMEEEEMAKVRYSIKITSIIEAYEYEHVEEGIVEEYLQIQDEIKILYSS